MSHLCPVHRPIEFELIQVYSVREYTKYEVHENVSLKRRPVFERFHSGIHPQLIEREREPSVMNSFPFGCFRYLIAKGGAKTEWNELH